MVFLLQNEMNAHLFLVQPYISTSAKDFYFKSFILFVFIFNGVPSSLALGVMLLSYLSDVELIISLRI